MCGIAGFVARTGPSNAQAILEAMGKVLHHRGPDFTGTYRVSHQGYELGLAHTLLSIIGSPQEGRQPFAVPGGVLLFNGALYNFRELAQTLKQKGISFATSTDTEVLAQGLALEGTDFLKRARGMFAFAFWNTRSSTLTLGRDPMGVKPLYWVPVKSGLAFASEYKALLPHLRELNLDSQAVYDYLRLRYVPGEGTFFKEVRKLAPGTTLELSFGADGQLALSSRQYFSFADVAPAGDLFSALEQAMQRRAVADVPIAALLSGGIDSSLVCDLLSRGEKRLRSYTLGFPGHSSDETSAAKRISTRLGIENKAIAAVPPSLQVISDLIYALDDPYGDPIILALNSIFRQIEERVVVTGEGSDEIFSGYIHHRVMGMLRRWPDRGLSVLGALSRTVPLGLVQRLFPYSGKLGRADFKRLSDRFSVLAREQNLAAFQGLFLLFDEGDFVQPGNSLLNDGRQTSLSLRNLREWDFKHWLPSSQLFKLDKISMKYSIEAREPFVDVDLVAAVRSIDEGAHTSWNQDKPVLRSVLKGRTRLPPEVVSGRKSSFFQPFEPERLGPLLQNLRGCLAGHREFLGEFLTAPTLEALFTDSDSGLLCQKKLFCATGLALWRERVFSRVGTGVGFD